MQNTSFFCTFLCRCFARLQRETSRNFLATHFIEEMLYMFLLTFSLPLIFSLVTASIFSFSHRRYKFMLLYQQKMAPYLSLLLSVALFLVEPRWPFAYFLFFSVFLFLYIPNLWTWQLI